MVDYYREEEEQPPLLSATADKGTKVDAGIVCPRCYKPIAGHSVISRSAAAGINLRTYLGWCIDCNIGFEVEQFGRDGVWFIHRFRLHKALAAHLVKYQPENKWQIVNKLPAQILEAVKINGMEIKGIDLTPDLDVLHIVEGLKNILESVTQTADTLLQILKKQK